MNYFIFLAVFVVPVAVGMAVATWLGRAASPNQPVRWMGIGALCMVALAYTIPWEIWLIGAEVWWYGAGVVNGTLWSIPFGELVFIAAQACLVSFWGHTRIQRIERAERERPNWSEEFSWAGLLLGLLVGCIGGALLVWNNGTYYLGALLIWAGPVLAVQWALGAELLVARWRRVAVAVAIPTLYLAIADRIAIEIGLWSISPVHTLGVSLLGLPIEEALFFALTNLFLVQGVFLWGWIVEPRWSARSAGHLRERVAGR